MPRGSQTSAAHPWTLLAEVYGRPYAELLQSHLEAEGIATQLFQEAIGHNAYPVLVNGLARVKIFVPRAKLQPAQTILQAHQKRANPTIKAS